MPALIAARRILTLLKGVGVVPAGYILLVDTDGAYLTDADGAYLMELI